MNRTEYLKRAAEIISGEREKIYGNPRDNFQLIADLWSRYLASTSPFNLDCRDVANMMILLKIARSTKGNLYDDTWVDIAGYAALGGELAPHPSIPDVMAASEPVMR